MWWKLMQLKYKLKFLWVRFKSKFKKEKVRTESRFIYEDD